MDLLRLVLSWQSLDRLFRLRVLVKSKAFISTRLAVVNGKVSSNVYYPLQCVSQGELFHGAVEYTSSEYLNVRAIFLCKVEDIANFSGSSIDFWYAIRSGIPEIQDLALKWPPRKESLLHFNDLLDVPWTPELLLRIRQLLEKETDWSFSQQRQRSILAGFVGATLLPDMDAPSYYIGKIRSSIRDNEIMEYDSSLHEMYQVIRRDWHVRDESLHAGFSKLILQSGYLYPMIEILERPHYRAENVRLIINKACEPLLRYLAQKFPDSLGIAVNMRLSKLTRRFVCAVRNILQNESLRSVLHPETWTYYRVCAGDYAEDLINYDWNIIAGNPGTGLLPVSSERTRDPEFISGSLQSLVIYDPIFQSYEMYSEVANAEAFRLGRWRE